MFHVSIERLSHPVRYVFSLSDSFKNLFDDFKQSFDNDITPFFGLAICIWGESASLRRHKLHLSLFCHYDYYLL